MNPACLKEFTDVIITSHGSSGLEYPSFGIPSIVAENSFYTNFGFTLEPKNVTEYKNLLKAYSINIPVPKPIAVKQNVLVMEFQGIDGSPFPTLSETEVSESDLHEVLDLVTKLYTPPLPFLSPGYQFCTVEYFISASS